MHVALAVTSTEFGGAEKYLISLYERLVLDHGVQVTVCGSLPGWPSTLGRVLAPEGDLGKLTRRLPALKQLRRAEYITRHQASSIRMIGADVVHMQYKREQILLSPRIRPRTPMLWTEHGAISTALPLPLRSAYRIMSRKATVVSVAEHVMQDLDGCGVASHHIPSPLPEQYCDDAPADDNSPDVIYVGRLHPSKRINLLLDVAASMADTSFVVAGDGPSREELERTAPANVEFVGHLENPANLYARARVLFLPSGAGANEGLPLTVLEARALRLPVVITADNHASAEAAELGAVVVEDVSVESISTALRESIQGGRHSMSENAIAARTEANWCGSYKRMLDTLAAAR